VPAVPAVPAVLELDASRGHGALVPLPFFVPPPAFCSAPLSAEVSLFPLGIERPPSHTRSRPLWPLRGDLLIPDD
jgi:hypothetical protein